MAITPTSGSNVGNLPGTGTTGATGTTTGTTTTGTGALAGNGTTGLITSAGLGSKLDVNTIVTALVNAKQSGPQAQITSQATAATTKLGGLASLQSALSSLQTAVSALTQVGTFSSFSATLADTTIGSAATMSNAQAGSYTLDVTQLATAQKRVGAALDVKAPVGAGTLTIGVGSQSMQLSVSASDTLVDVANNINQATGNPGVTATVVYGAGGAQLLLSSSKTGVANGFSISASGDSSGGLAALASQLGTPGGTEAQDAQLTLDGIAITSASNSVSGAIDGVTINLSKVGTTELDVSQDSSAATKAVQDFVSAYNSYVGTVGTLSSYDVNSGVAGVLLGDATLGAVQRQISAVLGSGIGGNAIGSLAALGVTRQPDGTMTIDADRLSAGLSANPGAAQDLFAGAKGYATRLTGVLNGLAGPSGVLATQQTSLNASLTKLNTQQTQLNARMSVYQAQLLQQYTALDTMMSQLNNTSSYLTSALAAMEASYTKGNN